MIHAESVAQLALGGAGTDTEPDKLTASYLRLPQAERQPAGTERLKVYNSVRILYKRQGELEYDSDRFRPRGLSAQGRHQKISRRQRHRVHRFRHELRRVRDYPVFADAVCKAVASGGCSLGILCCGTGIGMSMAANKHKGIRAAVCSDYFSAKYTRLHNDANVLCLGARVVGTGIAEELVGVSLPQTSRAESTRDA